LYDLVKKMPSTRISNYIFRNTRDLGFSNESITWGVDEAAISSGAAYADLDNDGDLDLIVCNNNDPVWIYQNNENTLSHNNFIKIRLEGDQKNIFGIGAKVVVIADSNQQVQEMYPVRGYQSSVDYTLNFGLGRQKQIEQVKVFWSADSVTIIRQPAINTTLTIAKKAAVLFTPDSLQQQHLFADVTSTSGLNFIHRENKFVDFKREFLVPYELSKQGPPITKGDVNKDSLEDVFIGGASGQSGVLYLQQSDGVFKPAMQQPWVNDALSEDTGCRLFDADNDGDLDLYVVSGGSEWAMMGTELQDRLYENDGNGNYKKLGNALPQEVYSGSCITANDFDKDGDLDLFVGARTIPGNYPLSAGTMLLRNDWDTINRVVHFTDITMQAGGDAMFKAGMVTDAVWNDIDKDGYDDLLVVGEWMPITIFKNEKGKKLLEIKQQWAPEKSAGWWCRIIPADIDRDGDMDFIVGNLGTNTQFKTNTQQPLVTYVDDFNNDGRIDPIMTWYTQNASYPFNSRDELIEQIPTLNKKFLKYADYANATIQSIISDEQIKKSAKLYVFNTRTSLLVNEGGRFTLKELPVEAQFSMMNAILYKDYDNDGLEDILLAGNFYPFRVQQGRCDASMGCLLKGDGKGGFTAINRSITGLYVPGDTRNMLELNGKKSSVIIIAKNNEAVQVIKQS